MFEITIRGITKEFETAAEMAEWQESMRAPVRQKFKPHRGEKKKEVKTLKNYMGSWQTSNAPDS